MGTPGRAPGRPHRRTSGAPPVHLDQVIRAPGATEVRGEGLIAMRSMLEPAGALDVDVHCRPVSSAVGRTGCGTRSRASPTRADVHLVPGRSPTSGRPRRRMRTAGPAAVPRMSVVCLDGGGQQATSSCRGGVWLSAIIVSSGGVDLAANEFRWSAGRAGMPCSWCPGSPWPSPDCARAWRASRDLSPGDHLSDHGVELVWMTSPRLPVSTPMPGRMGSASVDQPGGARTLVRVRREPGPRAARTPAASAEHQPACACRDVQLQRRVDAGGRLGDRVLDL
jgi:hypothetical protein